MHIFKLHLSALICLIFIVCVSAQLVTDPLPYAPIANPLPDTMDQIKRDSVNLKISRVRVNQAGYRPEDKKYFYYVGSAASSFKVINNDTKQDVGTGTMASTSQTTAGKIATRASNNSQIMGGGDTRYTMSGPTVGGTIYQGVLPDLAPGSYKVVVGSDTSGKFVVNEQIYSWVRDAVMKFFGVNRCGDTHSWFHKACHTKDFITGGWHDCGDHLKEGITQGYTAAVLGLTAAVFQDRDVDVYGADQSQTIHIDGIPDILYEAKIGTDYILQSYSKANGQVSNMVTSMGDFGNDHNYWEKPEYQDGTVLVRGGPPRAARKDLGGNVLGDFAADLAFVSKLYKPYNAAYSDSCLKAAKAIYEFTKLDPTSISSTSAYNGSNSAFDDIAFAAMALIWATGDKKYLNDLCYDKTIGKNGNGSFYSYDGGWFVYKQPIFCHDGANTDWASTFAYVIWGFYRLVLEDQQLCTTLGITDAERLKLIEKTAYHMIFSLNSISDVGDQTITVPDAHMWKPGVVKYKLPWFTMHTQMEWVWNRYQAGNITEMYMYYDMASRLQGTELPNTPGSTNWNADAIKEIIIRQMDYMLGVNPWDISMIYGVGDKNCNHPHHRAANPEGKNVPGAFYRYVPPAGALQGAYNPDNHNFYNGQGDSLYEFWGDYNHSETGIDAAANILIPAVGLAKKEVMAKPSADVSIAYVGCDNAVIDIRQSRFGNSTIEYGTGDTPNLSKPSDSAGISHRIELTNLKPGTGYSFDVKVSDLYGNDSTIMSLDEDNHPVYFSFKTLSDCPTDAQISKVKVCHVTSDSAEIFWYTPNGYFDSKVVYDTLKPPVSMVHDGDAAGVPVKFHYVKIGGLKEKTTYYFYVQSGTTKDNNQGQYYKFTTPVEHVDFDVRADRYTWEGMPAMGIGIINQSAKYYDSLDLRLYFRAKESTIDSLKLENDLVVRLDIGIVYREDGYQDTMSQATKTTVKNQRPVKMLDTYNPEDSTYAYYVSVPLYDAQMRSQSRMRVDLIMDRRSGWAPYQDPMNMQPRHTITNDDWSWGSHRTTDGDPVDYPGIPTVTNKDDIDNNYWNLPINYYITVYRKGEFIWGYSPSYQEQKTKINYFVLKSQVMTPLVNPSDSEVTYASPKRTVNVSGYAMITPVEGVVNDMWVNGVPVTNLSQVVKWNQAENRYDFTVPVSLPKDYNSVDITIFGGPDTACTECYGCANYNHHFNVTYIGAKQYPSTMTVTNHLTGIVMGDTAHVDTTVFDVSVSDRNGNINKKGKDTLYVTVTNPVLGDTTKVMLIETGDSTNVFQNVTPIYVKDLPALQTGPDQIAMNGGDTIWINYMDPTDSSDTQQKFMWSKANFPLARAGRLKDNDGNGSADCLTIDYNLALTALPDSFTFSFPDASTPVTLKRGVDSFALSGTMQVTVLFSKQLAPKVTAFSDGQRGSGKSYLPFQGATKISAFPIVDSIGPVLKGSALLCERLGDAGVDDTVTISFSEPIDWGSITGDALLYRSQGVNYPLKFVRINSVGDSNTVTAIVNSGSVKMWDGDSILINSQGTVKDLNGISAHPNNPPIPIRLKAAPPRATFACYRDVDGNGKIDNVEITFTKDVVINKLLPGFSWNNGKRVPVDVQRAAYAAGSQSKIIINIEGLVTGDEIVTSGTLRFSAAHNEFPGDTIRLDVADSAAPVIKFASYSPSSDSLLPVDTLKVTFSEAVPKIILQEPFSLLNTSTGKPYSMKMRPFQVKDSATQVFLVDSIVGIEFPDFNDSIRINTAAKVIDNIGNEQDVATNHYAWLQVKKTVSFKLVIKTGPNPFKAGVGVGRGTRIVVNAVSRFKTVNQLSGKIKILDALGNVVLTDTLCNDNVTSSRMTYVWDGRNRNNRWVGSGTYLVYINAQSSLGPKSQTCKIGVRRAE